MAPNSMAKGSNCWVNCGRDNADISSTSFIDTSGYEEARRMSSIVLMMNVTPSSTSVMTMAFTMKARLM